jgi:hypothetical protein
VVGLVSVTAALSGAAGSLAGDSAKNDMGKKGTGKKGAGPVAYLKAHKGVAWGGAAAVVVGAALYAKSKSSSSAASGTTTPATTATSSTPATYTGTGGGGWGNGGSGGETGGGSALLGELTSIETTLQGIQATDVAPTTTTPPTTTGTTTPPLVDPNETVPPQQVTTITVPPSAPPGSIGVSIGEQGPSASYPVGSGPVATPATGETLSTEPSFGMSTLQALTEGEQNSGSSSGVVVPKPTPAPVVATPGHQVLGSQNLNESELQGIH